MSKKVMDTVVLEEYRQLSAEIRSYFDRQNHSTNFAIIITSGIVGVAIKYEIWQLFPITALLIAVLWLKEIMRNKAVWRASAYIQVFIESKIPELRWHTTGEKHPSRDIIRGACRILSNAVLPLLFGINLVLFRLKRGEIVTEVKPSFVDIGLAILVFIFVCLAIKSVYEYKHGRRNEVRNYLEKQKK